MPGSTPIESGDWRMTEAGTTETYYDGEPGLRVFAGLRQELYHRHCRPCPYKPSTRSVQFQEKREGTHAE